MQSNILTLEVNDEAYALIYELAGLILFERGNLPEFIIINRYKESLSMGMNVDHYKELETLITREGGYQGNIPALEYSHIHIQLDSSNY